MSYDVVRDAMAAATCRHCQGVDPLGVTNPTETTASGPPVGAEEEALWLEVIAAEGLLAGRPALPTGITKGETREQLRKRVVGTAEEALDEASDDLEELKNGHRPVLGADRRSQHDARVMAAENRVANARNALESAKRRHTSTVAAVEAWDAWRQQHGELVDAATRSYNLLLVEVERIARQLMHAPPSWVRDLRKGSAESDVEVWMVRVGNRLAYRRAWGWNDPVSALGPHTAESSGGRPDAQASMWSAVSDGTQFTLTLGLPKLRDHAR